MSASKKKLNRKEEEQGTQRGAMQQENSKNYTKVYWGVGIVCAVLVAALLIWNTGIFHKDTVALTIDERDYSIAEVEYYYYQLYNYHSQMASYGMSSFSTSLSTAEQVYDSTTGQTYEEYFHDETVNSILYIQSMYDAAVAAGFTISDEGLVEIEESQEYIDGMAALYGVSRKTYLEQTYGQFMTESLFDAILDEITLANEYADYYSSTVTFEDSESEAYYATYLEENAATLDLYSYRVYFIPGATSSDVSDEENEILQAQSLEYAEAAVALIEAADVADKLDVFVETMYEYASESAIESHEEDYDYTLSENNSGADLYFSSDWLQEDGRTYGDATTVESTTGYYVLFFVERAVDTSNTVNIRHILISAELDQADDADTEDVDESTIPSDAALDAAYQEAAALLDQWQSGDATAESFGVLAELNSDDEGSNTNGGAYTYVSQGEMFDAFDAWIFDEDRQSGDVELIENPQSGQYGWHVVYFEDVAGPAWELDAQDAMLTEVLSEWETEMMSPYTVTEGSGMAHIG